MSHLQPTFIAKSKAKLKHAQAARAMPRSMIIDAASSPTSATRPRKNDPETGWFWYRFDPDYRIFSLKK